MTENKKRALS